MSLAATDGRPARKSVYLRPLQKLHQACRDGSVSDVGIAVGSLTDDLRSLRELRAPAATAAAALTAEVHPGADCTALARAIDRQVVGGRFDHAGSLYSGTARFSPPLTAVLALAAIRHSLLPGTVHVVYALKAYSCQQAIYMGPGIGRKYGNPSLGVFVQLTSGAGVGHGKYDADQVNRARISPLGRIGGQPCR